MDKLKSMLYRFMYGRYGNDQLNIFMLGVTMVLTLINSLFFKSTAVTILCWLLLGVSMYRCYSKKIYLRGVENDKFLRKMKPFTRALNLAKRQAQDKEHKYFICPNCSQTVRVPKGKGKITITCPSCRNKFDRKS